MSDSADSNYALNESFPPLLGEHVHTLVLGSMPGRKSLQLQQYYAHQRNALWPILCAIANDNSPSYDVHMQMSYEQRCATIMQAGFALWDVLARCERPGSLDTSIVRQSEIPNPISQLIDRHVKLHTIVCNGRTAEALFNRHILPQLKHPMPRIMSLPSTSPAMASLSLQEKYQLWRDAILGSTI
ncbi:MAG: DNA-deoxyinosine glycosylase [Granulosicoccus sp.]